MISKYPDKVIPLCPVIKIILAVVFLLGAVGVTSKTNAEELTWTGCGITKKAFMAEIAEAYQKKTGIKIRISGGGATKGMRSAAAGTSDMGGTCRHWLGGKDDKHPQEAAAELIQVAWDALVVIVHPDNPVNNITIDELRKIYGGEIISWKELGGPDKRIALVTREGKDSGVGHMFRRMVFNDPEYTFKARSYTVKSSGPLEEKIARTVTGMGMDGISSAIRSNVKILALEGVPPSKENIIAGKYSLFRPLYIAIGPESSPETKKVIDFILSTEGQVIVSAQGTVNLEEGKNLQPLWEKKKKSLGL
jgi:phosphate transport system substrate-binding protein